jgi:hypothetical protein
MSKSSAITQKKELIKQLKIDFIDFDKFRNLGKSLDDGKREIQKYV